MASPNASFRLRLERSAIFAAQPEKYRQQWLTKCLEFGEARCTKPANGEVFDSPEDCFQRLWDWGFSAGCFFTKGRHRKGPPISREYHCCYHSTKLDNKHRLTSRMVQKDEEGKVLPGRQRNTTTKKAGCSMTYFISLRLSFERTDTERTWQGRWKNPDHIEACPAAEPLDIISSFNGYRKMLPEYTDLAINARKFREGKLTYHQARSMLVATGNPLDLDRNEYYNIIRQPTKDTTDERTARALIRLLEDAGWMYRLRTLDAKDTNERKLVQIFFWENAILPYIQRFTSDSLLYIDATFRTNQHGLPLIIAVGATNTNSTIPVAFSWCPEEDSRSYTFFVEELRDNIYKGIPDPAVILADQGAGLTSAFSMQCLPYSELQYCSWHAVSAIMKHLGAGKYTKGERQGFKDSTGQTVPGLEALCWQYIRSNTEQDLEANRQELMDRLLLEDRRYITEYWQPRESKIVQCYTKFNTNIGYHSTQRIESFNRTLHKVLNHQMPLEQAANAIVKHTKNMIAEYEKGIAKERIQRPVAIDEQAFVNLSRSITQYAIELINGQWTRLGSISDLPECTHQFRKQYQLPCAHDLQAAYFQNGTIVRSLVHPRWWINGHIPRQRGWKPTEHTGVEIPLRPSPQKITVQGQFHELMKIRDQLPSDLRYKFEGKIAMELASLLLYGQTQLELAARPIALPDNVQRFQRKIEIGRRQQELQAWRQQKQAKQEAQDQAILEARYRDRFEDDGVCIEGELSQGSTITVGPSTPLPPALTTHSVDRTPPSPPGPTFVDLPPSTAPPAMQQQEEEGRTRRKRAISGYYTLLMKGDSQEIKRARNQDD